MGGSDTDEMPKLVNAIITATVKVRTTVTLDRRGNIESVEGGFDDIHDMDDLELIEITSVITDH